jgi:N,N-dimethylformamidase
MPVDPAASWDFADAFASATVRDRGPYALHGTTINSPVRAVRSSIWRATHMCFSQAPDQYAAAHFHSDDIDDCNWPATHEWTVPKGMPSACYALML